MLIRAKIKFKYLNWQLNSEYIITTNLYRYSSYNILV